MRSSSPTPPPGRASLLVLGMAAFMVQADARVIDPLLHVIARDFHTIPPSAAIVISAYALPYGLFQLFYGPLGDRIGKLRVMAACLALFAVGTFACAFVPNLPVFAVLRFLTGVAAAAVVPMSLGYIGDKFPYEARQIALARFMSALMMGQIAGSTLGGIFGQYLGWRDIFLVFGIVSLGVSALLAREGRRFPEPRKTDRRFGLPILAVPLGGSVIFVGMLGVLSFALSSGGGSSRRVSPDLRPDYAVRRHVEAAQRAAGSRHRAARRSLRLRRIGVPGLVVDRPVQHQLCVRRVDGRGVRGRRTRLQLFGEETGRQDRRAGHSASWRHAAGRGVRLHRTDARLAMVHSTRSFCSAWGTTRCTARSRPAQPNWRRKRAAPPCPCLPSSSSWDRRPARRLLGSILKSSGYGPTFITAGAGLFTVAVISRQMFAHSRRNTAAEHRLRT